METKTIPTLKERYKSLNNEEKNELRDAIMQAADVSRNTFYAYISNPDQMKARALEAFSRFFNVLPDELLSQPEKQTA